MLAGLVCARDRVRKLLLRHRGPAAHAQLCGALAQLFFRVAVPVNTAVGLAVIIPGLRVRGTRIGRPFAVFSNPPVAFLRNVVLELFATLCLSAA